METNRKLAAIMFTDMVGYTRLMQTDEQKAKLPQRLARAGKEGKAKGKKKKKADAES